MAMNPRLLRPKASGFKYQALRAGLVAYWPLNETATSGDVTARDESGRGYDLTSNNSVLSAAGKIGNAREFLTANSEYLSRASNADLEFPRGQDWTISFWFYPTTTATNQHIFAKDNDSSNREFGFRYNTNGSLQFSFPSVGGATIISSSVTVNAWYFVAVRNLSQVVSMSTNRVTANPATYTAGSNWPVANTPLNVGRRGFPGNTEYYTGLVDEIAMWKRALSNAELDELYNSGTGINLGQRA